MADLQHMLTRLKLLAFMFPPLAKVMQVDGNFQSPSSAIKDNSRLAPSQDADSHSSTNAQVSASRPEDRARAELIAVTVPATVTAAIAGERVDVIAKLSRFLPSETVVSDVLMIALDDYDGDQSAVTLELTCEQRDRVCHAAHLDRLFVFGRPPMPASTPIPDMPGWFRTPLVEHPDLQLFRAETRLSHEQKIDLVIRWLITIIRPDDWLEYQLPLQLLLDSDGAVRIGRKKHPLPDDEKVLCLAIRQADGRIVSWEPEATRQWIAKTFLRT